MAKKKQNSTVVVSAPSEKTLIAKTQISSVTKCILIALASFVGALVFAGTAYVVFVSQKLLAVGCPSTYNRVCNDHGTCEYGICKCEPLFSGSGCTDTQIPGYDLEYNTACSGNGFAIPFINVTSVCAGNWNSIECQQFVNAVHQGIEANGGDPTSVLYADNVPLCTCNIGFGGKTCAGTQCPMDENGLICGGNGNTSVGLYANASGIGNGCQCESLFTFFSESTRALFTPYQIWYISQYYNYQYNQRFCGIITAKEVGMVFAYSQTNNYKCFCEEDWYGTACTVGKCPQNSQTKEICWGHGSPYLGIGKLDNTTLSTRRDKVCLMNCEDGYSRCDSHKCVYDISFTEFPIVNTDQYCRADIVCPTRTPIRCPEGTCVSIPGPGTNQCVLGYTYGSIDIGQIQTAIERYKCPNLTSAESITRCFLNSTEFRGMSLYSAESGGVVLQNSNYSITVDLRSPLIYFELIANVSNTVVTTWDGQQIIANQSGLFTGMFKYESLGEWTDPILVNVTVEPATTILYNIGPMPWNYSGSYFFPSEYEKFRLLDEDQTQTNVIPLIVSSGSFIQLDGPQNYTNGLFVLRRQENEYEAGEPLYARPSDNATLTQDNCFSTPELCSWYKDTNQVRSLNSLFWICVEPLDDVHNLSIPVYPVVQVIPCSLDYSEYAYRMDGQISGWSTVLVGYIETGTLQTIGRSSYPYLQIKGSTRTTWPVTISWPEPTDQVLVNYAAFLTLNEGIDYPCACPPSLNSFNQTVLNAELFETGNMRKLTFNRPNSEINGQYAVGRFTQNSVPNYIRGVISSHVSSASVVYLTNEKTQETRSFYYEDVRVMSRNDYERGIYDCDLLSSPFRCTDGSCTTASAYLIDEEVDCNCTYVAPNSNCSCITQFEREQFGCVCNLEIPQCQCAYPALPDFQYNLTTELLSLIGSDCNCILFDLSGLNSSGFIERDQIYNPNNYTFELVYNYSQVIETIIVKTSDLPDIYATSYLFSNYTDFVTFEYEEDGGEYWIRLNLDPLIAYDTIIVESTSLLEEVRILFAYQGFPITASLALNESVYTASSNSSAAQYASIPDSYYWYPDPDARDYPIWIRIDYPTRYYVDFTAATFILTGQIYGNTTYNYTIPVRIYVQGTNAERGESNWFTLGSWGVYANETNPSSRTLSFINTTYETFSSFRLISYGAFFGVQHWDMYTKQKCDCTTYSTVSPVLNITSYDGLPTIQEELDNIDYYNTNVYSNVSCQCENNCIVFGQDVSEDGYCNDALYQGYLRGMNNSVHVTSESDVSMDEFIDINVTSAGDGISLVQFSMDVDVFLQVEDIQEGSEFYDLVVNGISLFPNPESNETDLTIYAFYIYNETLEVVTNLTSRDILYPNIFWIENTFNFTYENKNYYCYDLVEQGSACAPGMDCLDCGPSSRIPNLFDGYSCSLTSYQNTLLNYISNQNIPYANTYFIQDLLQLKDRWEAHFQGLKLTRRVRRILPDHCPEQACTDPAFPFKCKDGKCVSVKGECDLRYECPGNGCVQLNGVTQVGLAYRCACAPGYSGDACQFGVAVPAKPMLGPRDKGFTPPSQIIACGALPPFRLKPPILNLGQFEITPETIDQLNEKVRTGCGPRNKGEDIGYHCIMPLHAPFGQAILMKTVIKETTGLTTTKERTIWQSCACARKGYFGEQMLLDDDVSHRNPVTGRVTWKTYTNPFTGKSEQFKWLGGICTYNDFPFRCANGQCVENGGLCAQSERTTLPCNGPKRGTCMADGTCQCNPAYKTFAINNEISSYIRYPYYSIDGIPDPTIWQLNFNWRHYQKNQCTARNCDGPGGCPVVRGCFPGTPLLNFRDKYIMCPYQSGKTNRCAPSTSDCYAGTNLVLPLPCYGKGILRYKDITNEPYCICGDPISPLVNITAVAQESDLKPNGWGGENCGQYYADTSQPLIWSPWDFELDSPHRSTITGENLPGVWVKGDVIVGPDPNDKRYWDSCCSQFTRLEECDKVPCKVDPDIRCLSPQECLAISLSAPMVKVCNGHGRALADGRCLCDEGYTYELDQFSDKGCYRLVQCPVSRLSGKKCNALDQCTQPDQWRHPFPRDKYFEQQWYTCGLKGRGEYSNSTLLSEVSINVYNFQQQLVQSLGAIAISVLDAITSLAGCVCVHEGDTASDHCCMVNNGEAYQYDQNFKVGYKLNLTTGNETIDSVLFDYYINAIPLEGVNSYSFSPGDSLTIHLKNNVTTYIKALRIYGAQSSEGTVFVQLINSDFGIVCGDPAEPFVAYDPNSDLMDWNIRFTGGAMQCGPAYRCVKASELSELDDPCTIVSDSAKCRAYIKERCLAQSPLNVFWPSGSVSSQYYGCNREDDQNFPGGCPCCQLLLENQAVSDGVVTLLFTGDASVNIGNIELYGYTNEALPAPIGLTATLEAKLGRPTECTDERFMTATLQADKSYYVIGNSTVTAYNATAECERTGGYLGIPMTNPDILNELQVECDNAQKEECIVGAYDTLLNRTTVTRDEMFDSTCNYCYENIGSENGIRAMIGLTNSSFTTQLVSGQLYNSYYRDNFDLSTCTSDPYTDQLTIVNQLKNPLNPCIAWAEGVRNTGQQVNIGFPAIVLYYTDIGAWVKFQITPFMKFVSRNIFTESANDKVLTHGATYYIMYGHDIDLAKLKVKSSSGKLADSNSFTGFAIMPGYAKVFFSHETFGKLYLLYPHFSKGALYPIYRESSGKRTFYTYYSLDDYAKWSYEDDKNNFFYNMKPGRIPRGFTVLPSPGPDATDMFGAVYTILRVQSDFTNKGSSLSGNLNIGAYETLGRYMPLYVTAFKAAVVTDYSSTNLDYNGYYFGLPLNGGLSGCIKQFNTMNCYDKYPNQLIYLRGFTYLKTLPNAILTNQEFYKINTYSFVPLPSNKIPPTCSSCILDTKGNNKWRQQYYSESTLWSLTISYELPKYPYLFTTPTSIGTPLPSLKTTNTRMFIYQVMRLVPYSIDPTPVIPWDFAQCFTITSSGLKPIVCYKGAYPYICQYDWVKYAVVTGYQCDKCGPSTRIGGEPRPDVSCFEDNALANATLYPFQHAVKDAYLSSSLDIFAAAFNPTPEDIDFGNNSVVFGFEEAWIAWKTGFSSRRGQLSLNARPDLSWCDMSLTQNFPINCGAQIDPHTNLVKRYCASDTLYCNIETSLPENPTLPTGEIPKIFGAVTEANSYSDRSCGSNVDLSGYIVPNRYGAPQSSLTQYVQVLSLEPVRIKINAIDGESQWYNSGKTNIHISTDWDQTLSVYGEYVLSSCLACTNTTLVVFLYPLNPYYSYPEDRLEVSVQLSASGERESFLVNFTVNETTTGTFVLNGITYPEKVYKGVGYQFIGSDLLNSIITLYDPVLTNEVTRLQCTNRETPIYYAQNYRIESTSPYNLCIYTEDEQLQFPGQDIGTCGCDFAFAGDTCDCPAVTSTKYKERVCGGYGRSGKSVFAPDSTVQRTGTGENSGCYYYGKISDCDTVDIGRALYTLLVPGAIFEYPSVYINALPVRGVSIFQIITDELVGTENEQYHSYDTVYGACIQNGMAIPYFFSVDELTQLIVETRGALPVFVAIDTATATNDTWEWISNVDGSYFINELNTNEEKYDEAALTYVNACNMTPALIPDICPTLNFNNLAYNQTSSQPLLVNGDAYSAIGTASAGTLAWNPTASLLVDVYIFGDTGGSITCSGGCTQTSLIEPVKFRCRCADRVLTYNVGSSASEIQVFDSEDGIRTVAYVY